MWFKWFKKAAEQSSSADGMPELLAKTLAEFQSSEFPMPLDSLIQQASFNAKQNSLSLTLKFPWSSLADELLPVLQQVQPDLHSGTSKRKHRRTCLSHYQTSDFGGVWQRWCR